jgi:hypothetical protein
MDGATPAKVPDAFLSDAPKASWVTNTWFASMGAPGTAALLDRAVNGEPVLFMNKEHPFFLAIIDRLVPFPITVEGYAKALRHARKYSICNSARMWARPLLPCSTWSATRKSSKPYRLPFDCTRLARSGQQAFFRSRTKVEAGTLAPVCWNGPPRAMGESW